MTTNNNIKGFEMMENVICDIPSGLAGTTSKSKFEGKFIIDMPAVIGIEDNINSKIMYLTATDNGYMVHYHNLSFSVSKDDGEKLDFLCVKER